MPEWVPTLVSDLFALKGTRYWKPVFRVNSKVCGGGAGGGAGVMIEGALISFPDLPVSQAWSRKGSHSTF